MPNFRPYKFPVFLSFFQKEYDKVPNFVGQFHQRVKNYPDSTRKISLEITLAGGRLDREPIPDKGNFMFKTREFRCLVHPARVRVSAPAMSRWIKNKLVNHLRIREGSKSGLNHPHRPVMLSFSPNRAGPHVSPQGQWLIKEGAIRAEKLFLQIIAMAHVLSSSF